jgi:hypothetical protein
MAVAEKCISASLCTVELLPSDAGTDLIFTHQAAFFEGADGPEMREDGWRKLPGSLAAAERWIRDRRTIWERRLDRLGELLANRADADR